VFVRERGVAATSLQMSYMHDPMLGTCSSCHAYVHVGIGGGGLVLFASLAAGLLRTYVRNFSPPSLSRTGPV
jgi:hypothetical protein